jgi:hypothetical protein
MTDYLRLTLAPGIDARLPGRVRGKCRARSQGCSRFPQSVACLPFNFQLSTLNCFSASPRLCGGPLILLVALNPSNVDWQRSICHNRNPVLAEIIYRRRSQSRP